MSDFDLRTYLIATLRMGSEPEDRRTLSSGDGGSVTARNSDEEGIPPQFRRFGYTRAEYETRMAQIRDAQQRLGPSLDASIQMTANQRDLDTGGPGPTSTAADSVGVETAGKMKDVLRSTRALFFQLSNMANDLATALDDEAEEAASAEARERAAGRAMPSKSSVLKLVVTEAQSMKQKADEGISIVDAAF